MATTVLQAMSGFQSAIQPTPVQTTSISTSHQALRTYLRQRLAIQEDFLTGSYVRNTMIRQSRDCDMFIVLHPDYWEGTRQRPGYGLQRTGPANLLDGVKRLLEARYTLTSISRDGQAVRVQFQHIHMDVVPAFATRSGYLIPDTPTNSWIASNPRTHVDAIRAINTTWGGRLVPLVKMIKYWNIARGLNAKGFFLEMWVRDMFQRWSLPSFAEGVRTFFDVGLSYLDQGWSVADPGSNTDLMRAYMSSSARRDAARSRFATARDRAAKAIDANLRGDNYTAIAYWKLVFGDAFPSFG